MHAVGAGETSWVAEYLTDRVLRLDPRGDVLRTVSADFDAPSAVAVSADGAVFVPDFYHHQLVTIVSLPRALRAAKRSRPGARRGTRRGNSTWRQA